ncbi:MAG TPA: GNAT family N-acetyltransferase, partial [Candidatus Merdenecus merdavium]|nr:GNAT family N-acetyltransferase [Candidatus Merdenecus merdavium]
KSKILFSIWDAEEKRVIGHIQLVEIDLVQKSARIRRVLIGEKTMRNQGVGYQVMKGILDRCFFEWDLNLVTLHVFAYNKNAIACYKKAGFIIDPDGEETRIYKGKEYPLLAMFITRERFYHGNRNRGNQGED